MSNEEAIKMLKGIRCFAPNATQALDMAIKALEKQTEYTNCKDCKFGVIERQWVKCNYHNIFMKAEDACSKGVKKIK